MRPLVSLPQVLIPISRSFSSYGLLQQTLVQKIQSSSKNQTFLTLSESSKFFNKWIFTNTQTLINEYEEMILSRVELPEGVVMKREKVSGLHTLNLKNHNVEKTNELVKIPTVMIHGHCSSGIFYHRNFAALSKNIADLYTLDLPDVGLSDSLPLIDLNNGKKLKSKPKYDFKLNLKSGQYKIRQSLENQEIVNKVKDYYIKAIENWRIEQNLEKINLVGHSFGGYLSFWYGLKYPHRINKLSLISPAGVERSVFSLHNQPQSDDLIDEKKQSKKTSLDGYTFGLINEKDVTNNDYYRNAFIPYAISTFGFGLTKALGPLGIQLIAKYLSLRYERGVVFYNSKAREERLKTDDLKLKDNLINENDKKDSELVKLFVKYTILMFYQNQKSYFYLQCLLNNQILAFDPIFDHVGGLKNGKNDESFEFKADLQLLYGQYDWMNSNAGLQMALKHQQAGNLSDFKVVEDAGHNVFLDNSDEFNSSLLNFLRL